MAFIVGSNCVGCKDTACVKVRPVDCFYEGPICLHRPEECIDCAPRTLSVCRGSFFLQTMNYLHKITFLEINEKVLKSIGTPTPQSKRNLAQ